jgi:retinol dehydrogenase 12
MNGLIKVGFSLMRPFMISVEKGAETSIYLATTDLQNLRFRNGYYFAKSKPASIINNGVTNESVEWFWEQSLEATQGYI